MAGSHHPHQPRSCPDIERIAAHVDRRLAGDEATAMDEHLATCADCFAVYSETLQFRTSEAKPAPVWQRPAFRIAAGLALAATLVGVLSLRLQSGSGKEHQKPLVADLAQAIGDKRFIEPRLTGGFQHGRLIVLRGSETPQTLDAQSPAVLAAVARIRQHAESDTSAEALGALAVTYIVSGQLDAAVKALESATAQAPENPRLWSDLAAAYFTRARKTDEPVDLPRALECAERAVALPEPPLEAWFNRGLALEALYLTDAARKAWQDYLDHDAASGWADEARQHLEALSSPRLSSAGDDTARVRAALEQGEEAIHLLARSDAALLREHLEDELLPGWASAHLVGNSEEKLLLHHAGLAAAALSKATGDEMGQDTARTLTDAIGSGSAGPLRFQASGFRNLREGKRRYELQEEACGQFRAAYQDLDKGGSPYAAWARLHVVIACLLTPDPQAASTELAYLESLADTRRYSQLLGRVRWIQGLLSAYRGELTTSLERYRLAHASFQKTLDVESEATILHLVAENLHFLGLGSRAWRERAQVLALLGQVRNPRRRHAVLADALGACQDEDLPRSALHFSEALVQASRDWSRAAAISDSLLRRAGILHTLGDGEQAATDLQESRRWLDRIPDPTLAARYRAEVESKEGELLLDRQPEVAATALGAALSYFQGAAPTRVPTLRLLLGRAQLARGQDDAAAKEFGQGIATLEQQRASLRDASLQVSFFDQAQSLFDEMVLLQARTDPDPESSLAYVERGRARGLLESLEKAEKPGPSSVPSSPDEIRQGLPPQLALVYYLSLEDRLFAWALTRDGCSFVERGLPRIELTRLVAAQRAALENRASLASVREASGRLHEELVRPLASVLSSGTAIVFVPDAPLQAVAFASLWDQESGHYLVETHVVGVAPSGTAFVRASARADAEGRARPTRVLVVGNPRIDRRVFIGLPGLPGAEAEAGEIARLYERSEELLGGAATKAAFLARADSSQIVHFAGHADSGTEASGPRLLFAPDPARGDSGALYPAELLARRWPRTRVVVLAACRTAVGTASRAEGALSLSRPFLAAGVPSVVASLWPIDDSLSRRFFVKFHRALLGGSPPMDALRQTQLGLLKDPDGLLAHPASWAGFVGIGSAGSHSFLKGEKS